MQIRPSKNRHFIDWWGKQEEKKANDINRVKYFCTGFKTCPGMPLGCVFSAEASWPMRPGPTTEVHQDARGTHLSPERWRRNWSSSVLPSWGLSRKSDFSKTPPTTTPNAKFTGGTSTLKPVFQHYLSFGMGLEASISPSRLGANKRCSIGDEAKTTSCGREKQAPTAQTVRPVTTHCANAPTYSSHTSLPTNSSRLCKHGPWHPLLLLQALSVPTSRLNSNH